MRLRPIARPLARKGRSVIVAFLLSEFPNFRSDLERGVTPVEIAADRNRSIVAVEIQKHATNGSGRPYSITSAARVSNVDGNVRPTALAAFRLITTQIWLGPR